MDLFHTACALQARLRAAGYASAKVVDLGAGHLRALVPSIFGEDHLQAIFDANIDPAQMILDRGIVFSDQHVGLIDFHLRTDVERARDHARAAAVEAAQSLGLEHTLTTGGTVVRLIVETTETGAVDALSRQLLDQGFRLQEVASSPRLEVSWIDIQVA